MTIATPRISKVSKYDGIRSWSLPARITCPGSTLDNGELCPVCRGCYATGGNYRFASVKASRLHNLDDWKHDDWVDAMVAALDNSRFFRWFDSGDIYCVELAEKIEQVIIRTPWVRHWLPTKSYRVESIRPVLDRIAALPNVVVRYSSPYVDGSYIPGLHGSTVVPTYDHEVPAEVHICAAYQNEGNKCTGCRACWDKNVKVIAYVAHGRAMDKVLKSLVK